MLRILKRYLVIWLVILLGLCIVSLALHWPNVVSVCSNTFSAYFPLIGICLLIVGGIIALILSMF